MTKMIIDKRYITPFFSDRFRYIPEDNINNFFSKKNTYELSGSECDGFTMPSKRYRYIGKVTDINGINLDSVIMKQIDGDCSTIFSLTKTDCRNLGIEFENGLQLFPTNLNWVKCENKDNEEKEFDSEDLSTYPVDYNDRTIHFMVIKMSGFSYNYSGDKIITPDGMHVPMSKFNDLLKVNTIRDIGTPHKMDEVFIGRNTSIPFRIVTNKTSRTNGVCSIIDISGCIFLELCFEQIIRKENKQSSTKKNIFNAYHINKLGINPKYMVGESFDNVFKITINHYNNEILNNLNGMMGCCKYMPNLSYKLKYHISNEN